MHRKRTLHISWDWQLKSTPKELWPFVSDTNMLLKDLGQCSIKEINISNSPDPFLRQFAFESINRFEAWEEEPYEWEYPCRVGFVRHYRSGPYTKLRARLDLYKNAQGTKLQVTFWIDTHKNILSLFKNFKLKTIFKNRLKRTFHYYDYLIQENNQLNLNSKTHRLVRGAKKRIVKITEQLSLADEDRTILHKIIDFIRSADDLLLKRINPYHLADSWSLSPKKVFKAFLRASKAGLLNFNWDVHCPHCRKVQHSFKSLTQIREPVYCDYCNQHFNVNFKHLLQLSFTPHPLIRKISDATYCMQGPHSERHISVKQYLQAGETKYLKMDLTPGRYILRSSNASGEAVFKVHDEGSYNVHVSIDEDGFDDGDYTLATDPNLSIVNNLPTPAVVTLIRKEWVNMHPQAIEVTSSQLFRDLFADQVLKKGEKISVDDLTIMFTDLSDSTAIYNSEGDDKALGQLINHFEILQQTIADEQGAIVKTIGDSVMAVFCSPGQALRAFLHANEILSRNKRVNLQLKAGIHSGNCMAVNVNNRIDYFGTSVNIASRLVDYASANEIIISEESCAVISLDELLSDYKDKLTIASDVACFKGFSNKQFLIKSIGIDDSPLRLAI